MDKVCLNKVFKNTILLFVLLNYILPIDTQALFVKRISFRDGIEIEGDWLYINRKKFFINAIGYAPWRPGQWPNLDKVSLDLIEVDFKRIKEAGFNSIRTWDALGKEELTLAKKYGLKVIQGIWIDPTHDFSDSYFIRNSLNYIEEVVQWSKDFDNVIMYLVITEPSQEAVLYAGIDKTLSFFRKIKDTIQKIDNKPVSMDSWIAIGFLDHSLWDVITFNAFKFTPEAINKTMGFREYVKWFKRIYAKNKPLFIGETGGFSVSKKKLNDIGFGGNTEEEQAKGNIESIKEVIYAKTTGVCTVSWVDTWHYPTEPSIHNDHPWEWNGIVGFKDEKDTIGEPRKVYYALKEFNLFLLPNLLNNFDKYRDFKNYKINLKPLKKIYRVNEKVEVEIEIIDLKGTPLKNKNIDVGFFLPLGWKEEIKNITTNKRGKAKVKCDLIPENTEQYLIVSIGFLDKVSKVREGNLIFIKLKPSKDK